MGNEAFKIWILLFIMKPIENIIQNGFINIKIKNERNEDEKNNTIIQEKKSEQNSISILTIILLSDFNKRYSNFFEELINQRFIKYIEKDKIIYLPNVLFMQNFKIPIINKEKNLVEFISVHLDFFNPKKKYVKW